MTHYKQTFEIAGRSVGHGANCLIVGEVGQAHDGSLGTAHALIDAMAGAGVDAVKFQTHIASEESTTREPWRVPFSPADRSRLDYWRRMEFTSEQWAGLKDHCDRVGVIFLSSPFSLRAVRWLERIDIPAWKIASGELGHPPLLEACARSGLPILLSSGMSSLRDLDDAVAALGRFGSPLAVLQCTSAYPCPPEQVGLNVLAELESRYRCPVGLSDHSGEIYPSLAAATLGAKLLEVHVTFSKEAFGPDVVASLTVEQLRQMIEGVRFIERCLTSPVDKDAMAAELKPLRRLFGRSVVLSRDLEVGTVLESEHLALKKPGTGMPAGEVDRLIGRRLRRSLPADHALGDEDLQ